MEISLVSEEKLKVSLTQRDFEKLGISYGTMNYADEATRRALLTLLEKAKREVGFSPKGAKLFIEVYQNDEGGCEMYFTCIRKPAKSSDSKTVISPTVFEFEKVNDLIAGALKTLERYGHRIYKSSLYLLGEKYRLLVYHLDYSDNLSVYFLSEFGTKLGNDEILAAYTVEHGREIIADTALDVLSGLFSCTAPPLRPPREAP